MDKTINIEILYNELFLQLLGTLFLIFLIKKYAWKSLVKMVEERKITINKSITNAFANEKKTKEKEQEISDELIDIKNKKITIIKETEEKAKQKEQEILEKAYQQSKEIKEKANQELEKNIALAKNNLTKDLNNLTLEMVEKILKVKLDEKQEEEFLLAAVQEVKNDK